LDKSAKISQQTKMMVQPRIIVQEEENEALGVVGPGEGHDNREMLTKLFNDQRSTRSRNVVKELGDNFSDLPADQGPDQGRPSQGSLNPEWFGNNDLSNPENAAAQSQQQATTPGPNLAGLGGYGARGSGHRKAKQSAQAQPAAPEIAAGEEYSDDKGQFQRRSLSRGKNRRPNEFDQEQQKDVQRYQQKLQQQQGELNTSGGAWKLERSSRKTGSGDEPQPGANEDALRAINGPVPSSGIARLPAGGGIGVGVNSDSGLVGNLIAEEPSAGLASLDFELPVRGEVYNFITPRGDIAITADAVRSGLLVKLLHLGIALAALLVFGYAVHLVRQGRLGLLGGQAATTLMLIVGAVGMLIGILPIAAAALFTIGLVLKIRRSGARPAAARVLSRN
jgi:hypothetical protein